MPMSSLSLQCLPFGQTKIIMQSKGAGGLHKTEAPITDHFNSPDNNAVMAALRLDALLSDSRENQFDRTRTIHAEKKRKEKNILHALVRCV